MTKCSNEKKCAVEGHQRVYRIFENNWDLSTLNKLSKNCSKWVVQEVMRGQVGDQRYLSRTVVPYVRIDRSDDFELA